MQRYYVFDFLRAIACLFVFFGHWACFHLNYDKFIIPIKIHQIGVGIFFFISGYLMAMSLEKYASIKKFFINRFFRIIPCIVSIILLYLFLKIFFQIGHFKLRDILFALTFSGDFFNVKDVFGMPMWTLHVETRFYFLIALAFFFRKKFDIYFILFYILLSVLLISLGLIALITISNRQIDFASFLYNNVATLFVFFGTLFYIYQKNYINKGVFFITSFFILSFVLCAETYLILIYVPIDFYNYYYLFTTMNHIFGLFVAMFLVLKESMLKPNKVIIFIANISYPVYLIHFLPLLKYKYFGFLLTILISYLIHIFVEKPWIMYSKNTKLSIIEIYKKYIQDLVRIKLKLYDKQ